MNLKNCYIQACSVLWMKAYVDFYDLWTGFPIPQLVADTVPTTVKLAAATEVPMSF